MPNKGIDFVLSLQATRFQSALNGVTSRVRQASGAVGKYWQSTETGARKAGDAFVGLRTKVAGAVAAIGGLYAVKATWTSLTTAAMDADKATFNLSTSINAANREFQVGSTASWAQNVRALTEELKVYSGQAIEEAAAKTIMMTKRYQLNEQQMVKVIRAAANLGVGNYDLAQSVEDVTAAIRGEAEASEKLGLTLGEPYVKAAYEAAGATKGLWKDLNEAEKAQIRLGLLLQQSDPLLGKAAASANTYGGALSLLGGNFTTLKAALGQVVTENNFFVTGINKIAEIVKSLTGDVEANKAKWMEWAKQGALGAMDFGIAGVRAASQLYSAFNGVAGAVQRVAAYYYELRAAFLEGSAMGAKFKDALGITSGEANRLALESSAAAAKSRELSAAASANFATMGQGAPKLEAAADAMQKFRDQAAQTPATKIIPVDQVAQEAAVVEQKIVNVGGVWTNVVAEIGAKPIKPQIEIEQEAYAASLEELRKKVAAQAAEAEKVNVRASRGASGSWADAAGEFESSWSSAIAAISRQLDSIISKAKRASSAASSGGASGSFRWGGPVQRFATGGRLGGYGGGDRIPILAEGGEFVIRKEGVRFADRLFPGLLQAINGLQVPKFAAGGMVGASGSPININLSLAGNSYPMQTSPMTAEQLQRDLARAHRLRSR